MSYLLNEIRNISEEAARELESAGFVSDSDIKSLNRQDLLELLPGKDKLRVRKEIHKRICGLPSPQHGTIKDLKDFFLSHLQEAGLTDNETLLDYLQRRKASIEVLIDILEKEQANPPEKTNEAECNVNSARQGLAPNFSLLNSWKSNWAGFWQSQETHATPSPTPAFHFTNSRRPLQTCTNATVMYKMEVSGNTLGMHKDVMQRLNGPVPGRLVSLQLKEAKRDEDRQVTIVFCPIVSRVGTDVDSALQCTPSDKPVIVVAMHHLHTPAAQTRPRANSRLGLGVNVFFHETKGLLNCALNDEAIDEMKTKLHEICPKKSGLNPQ